MFGTKRKFFIFYKPSHRDTTLHNRSIYLYKHNLAAYNSMIHVLIIFKKILIAINNGYMVIIDKILKKKQYTQENQI